ncbi:MAG: DHH family phosphoesterase [Lachnospiraceae bacterium]|nr:DHH family phosphoesterase [Lachnospiraceae bacterium]
MSLVLEDLLKYDDIVIQCHDNPDADALASGFALKWYLNKHGKDARFIYGGRNTVQKKNLKLMINNLNIEVEHVQELKKPQLLVTVDCQYGESNVTKFEAETVAVIDHHQVSGELPSLSEVRSNYGSCATVIYELLSIEDIDVNEDEDLATALFYGLMTDTGGFSEVSHPSDKDLRDIAKPRFSDIILFKNSNISKEELVIAGDALKHANYDEEKVYAIVEAKPCDPNILGIISDMLLEVDSIDTCLVYSILPFGVKISVRSCVKEVKASEMAAFLTAGYGGGGGHLIKAGGLLKKDLLIQAGISYDNSTIRHFLDNRMHEYFENIEIIYAGERKEDVSDYLYCVKKEVKVGYVECNKIAPVGTKIMIRTLEGDVDVEISDDLVIIIGVDGEIYPTNLKKFSVGYRVLEGEEYVYPGEYAPKVTNNLTGERIKLLPYAKACVATGGAGIYAKELDHRVKVFTTWDPDKYYLGVPGDYLAVRTDDYSDIYVIAGDIFYKTYDIEGKSGGRS